MRMLKIAAVAAFAMVAVPAVDFADDFEALCTATATQANAKGLQTIMAAQMTCM